MFREGKVGMYEGIVEPDILHGCEVCTLNVQEHQRVKAVEIDCISVLGVRRINRV